MEGSPSELREVLLRVFDDSASGGNAKRRKANPDPMEVQAEATDAYKAQLSRWSADVKAGIESNRFCFTMMIIHRCRQPLDHLHLFLQRKHGGSTEPSTLARLVWGKASEIYQDLLSWPSSIRGRKYWTRCRFPISHSTKTSSSAYLRPTWLIFKCGFGL